MRHVFKATQIGWDSKKEGIWFDADLYTREEAEAQLKPYHAFTQRGYPYTGYEFDGQKYHDYSYVGLYEDDKMPKDDSEI